MELMDLLPEYYRGNKTMEELQDILTAEINKLTDDLNETIDQCFVGTATKLLSRYEKIYGLQVDVSKSDAFRRERLVAKVRGIGTVTKQMLIDVASSYSNGEVEVIEYPSEYRFVVKFVGTLGIPANMADLTLTINEIKPAHLAFEYEYVYRTHAELSNYTHEQLSAYTHQQLREGALV